MRALVTGAAGLIGAHIVRALVGAGHEVRCLVRQTSRRGSLDGLPVTCVVVDLLDAGTGLDVACAGCDMVFHTAAHYAYGGVNSVEQRRTAVVGTETLLRACARQGVRSVVVTSSSVVFGYRSRQRRWRAFLCRGENRTAPAFSENGGGSGAGCPVGVPDDDDRPDRFASGTQQRYDRGLSRRSVRLHLFWRL